MPEIYIVRICRRGAGPTEQVVDLVEVPGTTLSASFLNPGELGAILAAPRKHVQRPESADSSASDHKSTDLRLYCRESEDDTE